MKELSSVDPSLGFWKLRLYGSFFLSNPEGEPVRVADRKVQGLLAVLALHRNGGIDRADAAEILWPSKAPVHLANLRQGLSVLRRVLGEEAIEASRQHCRLSSRFLLRSDFEDGSLREGTFMPGHDGDWFEEVRLESDLEADVASASESVLSSFYKTLEWFSIYDRRGMHALMIARNSLTRGIAYRDLLHLLRAAPDDPVSAGWAAYWQGTAEDDLEVCARFLRASLKEAKSSGDLALASDACLELGKVYSRTGKIERALRICDIADEVAAACRTSTAGANALRLRGNVWMNWEDQAVGANLLRRAEAMIDDPVELSISIGSRALLEASAGSLNSAARTMEGSVSLSKELGHVRISNVNALTNVLLRLGEGNKDVCAAELRRLVDYYDAVGSTQFVVYAEELLARLYYLEGKGTLAKQWLESAGKARSSTRMVVTKLEAQRVARIA